MDCVVSSPSFVFMFLVQNDWTGEDTSGASKIQGKQDHAEPIDLKTPEPKHPVYAEVTPSPKLPIPTAT